MIDKQRSVISKFIMNRNGDEENKTYSDESIVLNELENLNYGCINNIKINQEVINTKSALYSKNGNIDIDGTNINYSGLIYAPNGSIPIMSTRAIRRLACYYNEKLYRNSLTLGTFSSITYFK
ncbi:hypothetical protein [Anaeromicropila populeti]|uniref:Uncharacterized protein n=1 Tax=Anaeromicropila populeti TaxID=37658 RepID=A0A1I6I783_9FIRM|nr:hypothetical protein [Anaeromicropila populeti]SFR62514.1 hypothetical protein SAMN05661086_00496 [Anaeromicropila populeti]